MPQARAPAHPDGVAPAAAALWAQGRAAFLQAEPLMAAVVLPLQRAVFSESRSHWDADPGALAAPPAFAGTRNLALAEPGTRVDHFVRLLGRAYTALALAMEQPATALWPLSRRQAWTVALQSRHHAPLVRARAVVAPLALAPRFSGALWFRAEADAELLRLWFWAERMGVFAGGLVAVWQQPGGALLLRLCAHGSLHVDAYGVATLQALDAAAPACGWQPVQGACVSAWQHGSAVPGQRLLV